ncbi:MAG TPA: hypothetical protein DCS66_05840, partial [Flavobacteriaceae bacterium]|nr:hypothetical protein [Flavobacteriaceae bacterium]
MATVAKGKELKMISNQPTGGSPEQYDPYIANYGRKWSQMDPLQKRKLTEMAPYGGAGTGLTSLHQKQMVHHNVVPPWVGTGPQNTGYKRSGSQALAELQKVREYAHPGLLEGIGTLQPTVAANISSALSPGLSPGPTPDASTFLADAQQLSDSFGIPIQQAIIS